MLEEAKKGRVAGRGRVEIRSKVRIEELGAIGAIRKYHLTTMVNF